MDEQNETIKVKTEAACESRGYDSVESYYLHSCSRFQLSIGNLIICGEISGAMLAVATCRGLKYFIKRVNHPENKMSRDSDTAQ
jgi:hypothetical protein